MGVAQRYKRTPSEILGIDDPYTAYCLDEACALIAAKLDNKEEIYFPKEYTSFSDMYDSILKGG
jgi:hypothetical protein|nr:MAG TPA_asm: hypothetical protein [Caudoviricetes sp.]